MPIYICFQLTKSGLGVSYSLREYSPVFIASVQPCLVYLNELYSKLICLHYNFFLAGHLLHLQWHGECGFLTSLCLSSACGESP